MTVSLCCQIGSHSFVDFSEKGRKWLQAVKRSSLGIVIGGIKMNSAIFTKFSFRKIAEKQYKRTLLYK